MIIGVIADTHIPINSEKIPAKVEKYFKGVDLILHAGDLVELIVISQLRELSEKVEAVCGNMDSPEVKIALPEKKILSVGNYKIGLVHGHSPVKSSPENLPKIFNKKVDIIVFGHTHQPLNEEKNGILFFNPGSATDKIFSEYNTIGILELNGSKKGQIIKL